MKTTTPIDVELGPGGIMRKLSSILPPLTPRIVKARLKSTTHVSSKYESLDYDVWVNDLLIKEEQCRSYRQIIEINTLRWFLYFLVGVLTGLVAVFIDWSISFLLTNQMQFLVNNMFQCGQILCIISTYLLWYGSFMISTLIGAFLVVFIEPGAAGSGIPYIISYLNGISIPKFTTMKVLIVKIIGVILIAVAGLASGKEGPFIHIGSIIGAIMTSILKCTRIPALCDKISLINTKQEKRDLMAAGCAAGISAAFGSPVGATLMALEEGTSFWNVLLMRRIFFCAIVSTFTFNTILNLLHDNSGQHYSGLFYFGRFNDKTVTYYYAELPLFLIMGAIGGMFGALFVSCASKVAVFRMRYIKSRLWNFMDALFVAFLTATLSIVAMNLSHNCNDVKCESGYPEYTLQMSCSDGTYSEMSVYWLQGKESILRLMFHSSLDIFHTSTLLTFFVIFFVLFILTAGIKMPVGLFIPSLLIGATWGRLFGLVILQIFPDLPASTPAKYALIGAAAQLGGILRTTISLTVLVVEASGVLIFALPLMFTLFISKWVGDFFNEGIYEAQINVLGLPILPSDPLPLTSDIQAKNLMNTKVIVFPTVVSVSYLIEVLERVKHQGFPVVKETCETKRSACDFQTFGELRGFILRYQLMTLLITKSFTAPESSEDVQKMLAQFRKYEYSSIPVQELKFTEEEKQIAIDLKPYMNPSPYTVQMVMSFPRIFRLLRSLGLRHVIVIDNTNQVIGIITRKDLAKFKLGRHATSMFLKELRIR